VFSLHGKQGLDDVVERLKVGNRVVGVPHSVCSFRSSIYLFIMYLFILYYFYRLFLFAGGRSSFLFERSLLRGLEWVDAGVEKELGTGLSSPPLSRQRGTPPCILEE
jgi:hypothetical protein